MANSHSSAHKNVNVNVNTKSSSLSFLHSYSTDMCKYSVHSVELGANMQINLSELMDLNTRFDHLVIYLFFM